MNYLDKTQKDFIIEIKQKIRQAQYEAMKAVNVQLINLYWEIGKSIAEKQSESWGKSIVPTLSRELQSEFPGATGFSVGNLWLMAQFYTEYHSVINLVPLVREISWMKPIAKQRRNKVKIEIIGRNVKQKKQMICKTINNRKLNGAELAWVLNAVRHSRSVAQIFYTQDAFRTECNQYWVTFFTERYSLTGMN